VVCGYYCLLDVLDDGGVRQWSPPFKPVATTLGLLLVSLMMAAYGSGDGAAAEVVSIRERVKKR
jgi:hypothetical protein